MPKWFKKDRGKQYRTESKADTAFSFSLMLPGQKKLAGNMADMSVYGVAMSFSAEECPEFEREERIRLSLFIHESGKTVMLDALVKDSDRSQDAILYQFEFIDTTHLLRGLDPILVSYFNRREAFRQKPDPLNPVKVDLAWENHSAKGLMIDISVTGIALDIETSIARQIENADQVTMTFILPECDTPIRMVGKTAQFEPNMNNVRYSVEFDRKKTENIKEHQRSISRYVMQRQLVQLKRRAERPNE